MTGVADVTANFEEHLTALEKFDTCQSQHAYYCHPTVAGMRHTTNCEHLKAAIERLRQVWTAVQIGDVCRNPECLNFKKRNAYGGYRWVYCSEACSNKVRAARYRARHRAKNHEHPAGGRTVTKEAGKSTATKVTNVGA